MAALTAARNTVEKAHPAARMLEPTAGIAASTTIYQGGIVCKNASGYCTPGAVSTTLSALGVAQETAVGTTAGAVTLKVKTGIFKFNNSTAGDAITIADLETSCYIVDDNTVAKTNGTSTRSAAGTVKQVDADGVWVAIGLP